MRPGLTTLALGLLLVPALQAQTARLDSLRTRHATVTLGLGNDYAGWGGSIEGYLVRSPVSVFGAVGYLPYVNASDGRTAMAGGIRGYTGGVHHRLYVESAFAPLIADVDLASAPIPYGPTLALGYSYTSASGFTLGISRGLGWVPSRHRVVGVGNFGIGYTWHR